MAGSLPPLRHSYNPAPAASYEELVDEYGLMVEQLAEFVDVFLCETMGALHEARAATDAARASGREVWTSFTLQGGTGPHLLDGTPFTQACGEVAADAFLLNCCPPEQITESLPLLRKATDHPVGVYANAFHDMPKGWRGRDGSPLPGARTDMGAEPYAEAALTWVEMGADIVGGCCEIGPEHIACIRQRGRTHAPVVEERFWGCADIGRRPKGQRGEPGREVWRVFQQGFRWRLLRQVRTFRQVKQGHATQPHHHTHPHAPWCS